LCFTPRVPLVEMAGPSTGPSTRRSARWSEAESRDAWAGVLPADLDDDSPCATRIGAEIRDFCGLSPRIFGRRCAGCGSGASLEHTCLGTARGWGWLHRPDDFHFQQCSSPKFRFGPRLGSLLLLSFQLEDKARLLRLFPVRGCSVYLKCLPGAVNARMNDPPPAPPPLRHRGLNGGLARRRRRIRLLALDVRKPHSKHCWLRPVL